MRINIRKNIIIIIFASVLICGCHRADGQLQETVTDETTHQVDSFISPELVWQDNSRDLYSAVYEMDDGKVSVKK